MIKDPVCGMAVDETKVTGKPEYKGQTYLGNSEYKGQTYYFCSANCKRRFDHNPEYYLKRQAHLMSAKDGQNG